MLTQLLDPAILSVVVLSYPFYDSRHVFSGFPVKPVARPVFQGWQNCLGGTRDTKSEGLFHTLYYCNQIGNVCAGKDRAF